MKGYTVWNPEWTKVEQLGPVVNQSMTLLNVNDKETLKRFCFTSGGKFFIYFSSVPDSAVSDLISRNKTTESSEISVDLTYEMWRFHKVGNDINVQRLSQVNFGSFENWKTHETYHAMDLAKTAAIKNNLA